MEFALPFIAFFHKMNYNENVFWNPSIWEEPMFAVAYLLLFLLSGTGIAFLLLPRVRFVARVWLGLCLGLMLMMFLPALCAFIWDFSLAAHLAAVGLLAALCGLSYLGRDRRSPLHFSKKDLDICRLLLLIALPLTILGGYLQYTHVLRPAADGSLHVGQSTYGDLPLHLGIASSLRNASFPPDYSILPGNLLSYPFLTDSLSTTFMLMGFGLRWAIIFPGTLMMALTFAGYVILCCRVLEKKGAAALAVLFFFINGGLGFLYIVDMQGARLGAADSNELQSVAGLWNRIKLILHGWYQTPANHAEFGTYNLRWSNVIVDMMIPQRTTLGGWTEVLPCIYLLYDALWPENALRPGITVYQTADGPAAVYTKRPVQWRQMTMLGLWAGMLPMVNTHCFLALGLLSAGWLIYDLCRSRGHMSSAIASWAIYGGLAVAVALPQLFTWTFHQAVGNASFLQFRFNWVNNANGTLRDGYFWFYIKNIGLPFLLILLALLEKNKKRRFLASGAFVIFLLAEFIQFQPNEYDNNKLFYIWYMLCAMIAADYALQLLARLKGLRARPVIAVLCAVGCFATGALSIARECVSDYQMFSRAEVDAAEFVEENTAQHATFLTWNSHIKFVSALAGRNIVCGPDTWLYYHGFNTGERRADIRNFYADPEGNLAVLEKYGVDYILAGGDERYNLTIDWPALEARFEKVYESAWGDIVIFKVPEG